MEYARLPGLEADVSRVAFGAWAAGGWLWGGTDEDEAIAAMIAALERGVNLIDTAPAYGDGRSEMIVGKALERWENRSPAYVSTKCGLMRQGDGVVRHGSRDFILQDFERSASRLGRERIDVYFVHWPDPHIPVEETAEAMAELFRQGRIGAVGVSNFSPEQMDQFRAACPLHVCQPPYNLFERGIEGTVLPWRRALGRGVAVMTYGAVCRGLLTGRMSRERRFQGDDLRQMDPKFQSPRFERYLEAAGRLSSLARSRFGKDLLPLAVRWVLDQGADVAILGARRPDQVEPWPDVFGWSLDDDAKREIDAILAETVPDPVGPEFMAPPAWDQAMTREPPMTPMP